MKIQYKISLLIFLMLGISCDKSILDQENKNQYTTASYYKDAEQLTAATNGIYSIMLGGNLWGRMMQYFSDCRADEHAAGGTQIEVHNAQILDGTYDYSNKTILECWSGMYSLIHRSNAVIQYGSLIEDIDPGLKNQRIAEAKFFRAYGYYYLNANFGPVPVYTKVVENVDSTQGIMPEAQLYTLLESDLTSIQDHLKWVYTEEEDGRENVGRVNKAAVKLLLARVYMHQGKYAEAKKELLDIYDSKKFRLVDNYADNFMEETEYNEESIFEIGFADNGYGWTPEANSTNQRSTIMFQDYSPVGWRNCIPSDKLLNNFESTETGDPKTDPRLAETVYFSGDSYNGGNDILTDTDLNGNSSVFHGDSIKTGWKKYSPMYKLNPGGYYTSGINYRNMRFAEVLIKLAECENELGNTGVAIEYLNEIRKRPSVLMPDYPTSKYPCGNYDEVMTAIMHESMVEFSNEKLRVLELARWRKNNKFTATNPEPIGYIAKTPSKALYPYPKDEVNRNTNIN